VRWATVAGLALRQYHGWAIERHGRARRPIWRPLDANQPPAAAAAAAVVEAGSNEHHSLA